MTKVAFGLLLPTVEAMQMIFTKMVWGDFSKFSQKWFLAAFCAIFPNTHLVNLILGSTLQMEFAHFHIRQYVSAFDRRSSVKAT
jgi:hypothetical protein